MLPVPVVILLLQNVDRAGRTEADDVSQANLGTFHLSLARLTPEVPDDLDDVGDASRAKRVALGEQPAAGVDGNLPADVCLLLVDHAAGLTFAAEPEVLVVKELRSRETVVELDLGEGLGADAGLRVRLLGRDARHRVDVEHRGVALAVRVRRQHGRCDPDRLRRVLLGLVGRHEDRRRRAVAGWAAHVQGVGPGDWPGGEHFLQRGFLLVLRVRIVDAVLVVLHGHFRELLLRRAVLSHMLDAGLTEDARHQAGAHHALGAVLARCAVGAKEAHLAHLFAADSHRHVVGAGGDRHPRLAERRRAGGAGVGDVDHGYAGGAYLFHDPLADHGVRLVQVAADDDLDVLDRAAGVLQRADRRFGGERDDILVRISPELQHRGSDNSYVSHCSLPSSLPVIPSGKVAAKRLTPMSFRAARSLPSDRERGIFHFESEYGPYVPLITRNLAAMMSLPSRSTRTFSVNILTRLPNQSGPGFEKSSP